MVRVRRTAELKSASLQLRNEASSSTLAARTPRWKIYHTWWARVRVMVGW
jgi:hypothetical protein